MSDHPLATAIRSIDGRDYGAYRSLQGVHHLDEFELDIDRVPRDPFAPPGTGVFRVRVSLEEAGLTERDLATRDRDIATRDFVLRRFHRACATVGGDRRGTGWSGAFEVNEPGQAVLDRNAVVVADGVVEVRAFIGLPARGRKVKASLAQTMLLDELPEIVRTGLLAASLDRRALEQHQQTVEDAEALRAQLRDRGLVAFVADGSVLPRASGVDPRPLTDGARPFVSPGSMRVGLDAPHAGTVTGLAIRTGVTVIVGGGYHGKSTLLSAIAAGVDDHIPGDGRERVVALADTAPVRASPGRSVAGVDISPFIADLPDGRDTTRFSTANASGSTSQAAAISEALEVGAEVLLVDEDASATNLLVRDARMQALVARDDEPITVLLDRVRELHDEHGVSTVLVMGGAGDYLDVADHVIQMTGYEPADVTARAREVSADLPTKRSPEAVTEMTAPRDRRPVRGTVPTRTSKGKLKAKPVARDRILLADGELDLRDAVEQLSEDAQTRAVAVALDRVADLVDGDRTLREVVDEVIDAVASRGLDELDPDGRGRLASVRRLDLAAALNRVRDLEVR